MLSHTASLFSQDKVFIVASGIHFLPGSAGAWVDDLPLTLQTSFFFLVFFWENPNCNSFNICFNAGPKLYVLSLISVLRLGTFECKSK